jgi:hypothetical protein
MLELHFAYMHGSLAQFINMEKNVLLSKYPHMSESTAMGYAAAIVATRAQQENNDLTMENRRNDASIDDLYYWLTEESPCYIVGYIAQLGGTRSILQDMAQLDTLLAELDSIDWSYEAFEKRLISKEYKTWLANHKY